MKLLTVTVPCYNSEDYVRNCLESLLVGGEDVEILVIDDGSKDSTLVIAKEYEEKYPSIVKAIHQENGGHGEAVNTGLKNASGLYFKVVDSDDWVDAEAYRKILSTLKDITQSGRFVDMFISNFVYEKEGAKHKKVMSYTSSLPQDVIFSWNQMKRMSVGKYILMHSVIYRTKLLWDCALELPKHTFYVDNLFVFQPLPFVKTMYYLDVDFYRYYIGREDQSVHESVMISRIDQQIRVNKLMVDAYAASKITNKKLDRYMMSYLDIITTISSVLLIRSEKEDEEEQRKELWKYIKKRDRVLYYRLQRGITRLANMPGRSGRNFTVLAYKLYQKLYGFN